MCPFSENWITLTVNVMVLEDVTKYVIIEAHECASGLTQFFMHEMERHM